MNGQLLSIFFVEQSNGCSQRHDCHNSLLSRLAGNKKTPHCGVLFSVEFECELEVLILLHSYEV